MNRYDVNIEAVACLAIHQGDVIVKPLGDEKRKGSSSNFKGGVVLTPLHPPSARHCINGGLLLWKLCKNLISLFRDIWKIIHYGINILIMDVFKSKAFLP